MYKFQDTELKYNRRVRDSLIDIYGVGFQKASYVCDFLGLGNSFNINLLNNYFYELMIIIFKYYYILEERLKNLIFQRLDYFLETRRITGLRLLKGLPVRGQRTQSNRQNARNLRPPLVKKDEIIVPIVIKSSKGKGKDKGKDKGKGKGKDKGKGKGNVSNKNASKKGKKK
jgi:ribosomal protein S13